MRKLFLSLTSMVLFFLSINSSLNLYGYSIPINEYKSLVSSSRTAISPDWSALGTGSSSDCYAIAIDNNGNVYAGGTFSLQGGGLANGIAKWDGTSWSTLGTGLTNNSGVSSPALAIAIGPGGIVYAGGAFSKAGGASASKIACWNGTSWLPLGSGLAGTCRALAIDNSGNIYAGGDFTFAGGNPVGYIAKWNGALWSELGSGLDATCHALVSSNNGDIYAGGWFTSAGGNPAQYIAKWSGSSWSVLGTGLNSACFALAIDSDGHILAGGRFTIAGAIVDGGGRQIAKWDGSSWSSLGVGINQTGNECYAIAIDNCGNVYAGGQFIQAGFNPAKRIAKFDGNTWSALGTGLEKPGGGYVQCNAIGVDANGVVFVGGSFADAGGIPASHIAKWSGLNCAAWTSSTNGNWNDAGSWSEGSVPTSQTQVIIDVGVTVTISSPSQANSLELSNNTHLIINSSLTLPNINAITVSATCKISGSGTINGAVINDGGSFCMGNSPGKMTINGTFEHKSGSMDVEIDGTSPGTSYDQLAVSGETTIGAAAQLNLVFGVGFEPTYNQFFDIITAGSITGTYDENNISFSGGNVGAVIVSYPGGNKVRVMALPKATQSGTDLLGDTGGDEFGWSVALSENGSRVAIGNRLSSGDGDCCANAGHVRIFENNGSGWTQLGGDLNGEHPGDNFGFTVALSNSGNIVAAGGVGNDDNGSGAGHVRVYEYSGANWMQLGADIDGEAAFDNAGYAISLSADGQRVAIGAIGHANRGHVRIFDLSGGNWVQVGSEIEGVADSDQAGFSVSLSADGSRVAIGSRLHDASGLSNSGQVRVFELQSGTWTQIGVSIEGVNDNDEVGVAVAISGNGNRLVVGAHQNGDNGSLAGQVKVYQYDGSNWVQLGNDINGKAAGDYMGGRVSISTDGNRVAMGAQGNDVNGNDSGQARVYDLISGNWIQTVSDFDGDAAGDEFGLSSFLSADGTRLAVGGPRNDVMGSNAGQVQVFELNAFSVALPVTWLSISVSEQDGKNLLKWRTGSEVFNRGFHIQRSGSRGIWQNIGFVAGEGDSQGLSYEWIDDSPLSGFNYYRLKQEDLDGSYDYSKVVSIYNQNTSGIRIFPNPFSETLHIELQEDQVEKMGAIRMLNVKGQVVWSGVLNSKVQQIALPHLAAGVYWLEWQHEQAFQIVKVISNP